MFLSLFVLLWNSGGLDGVENMKEGRAKRPMDDVSVVVYSASCSACCHVMSGPYITAHMIHTSLTMIRESMRLEENRDHLIMEFDRF